MCSSTKGRLWRVRLLLGSWSRITACLTLPRLLPPLLAGLDFCRIAAPTFSAASRPDFFSPFLARLALPRTLCRLYRLASPSAALRPDSFCRLAAPTFAALRLPPSGHDFLWTGGPRGPESYKSLELKASPGAPGCTQSTTPPPPACYEVGTGTSPTVMTTKWPRIERSCEKTIAIGANPD
ncbi:uncharacterized protein HRG_10160 [Hirsutella rhossiliensis]|uniref:Secreted protein n=1 Tax=Hirsutella rhossiliensis TaxID=111463 RepID=A0A9P8SD86_9HYPO|nr:uncharacterized protein HRG_10160 [Hirsutella rhossiliensis]KAH0958473.1 hypothetical protein HRG_10160 [Hirsutella rhossiliensis]